METLMPRPLNKHAASYWLNSNVVSRRRRKGQCIHWLGVFALNHFSPTATDEPFFSRQYGNFGFENMGKSGSFLASKQLCLGFVVVVNLYCSPWEPKRPRHY